MDVQRIQQRSLTITVVGLGYVGLPTAVAFHELGFKVNGIDISEEVVQNIMNGNNPLIDSTSELAIPKFSESWNVSDSYAGVIEDSDIVIITVPTPIDANDGPNLEFIQSAASQVFRYIPNSREIFVILESTVFPGVTREIFGEMCNNVGNNVVLAYCPERVSPGDANNTVSTVSRVLGCDDEDHGEMLALLYSEITSGGCRYVGKIEVAEAAKLIENVQRDIDIAFVNELSLILPKIGVDVEDVLNAASSKWNFHRHRPGIGVGGHCIPVDPYYYISLSEKVGETSDISNSAREMNRRMPAHSSEQILGLIGEINEPRVLVLGYSYKPEVGDSRETPVLPLVENLHFSGVDVLVWDPKVLESDFPSWIDIVEDPLGVEVDVIVLATAHKVCLSLDWERLLDNCSTGIIYDGRRELDKGKMGELGWTYRGVGVPDEN